MYYCSLLLNYSSLIVGIYGALSSLILVRKKYSGFFLVFMHTWEQLTKIKKKTKKTNFQWLFICLFFFCFSCPQLIFFSLQTKSRSPTWLNFLDPFRGARFCRCQPFRTWRPTGVSRQPGFIFPFLLDGLWWWNSLLGNHQYVKKWDENLREIRTGNNSLLFIFTLFLKIRFYTIMI